MKAVKGKVILFNIACRHGFQIYYVENVFYNACHSHSVDCFDSILTAKIGTYGFSLVRNDFSLKLEGESNSSFLSQ